MTKDIKLYDEEEAHVESLKYASENAGEYLEELKKTDLADLSYDEWMELLNVVQKNYFNKKNNLTICPF
tara:strand:- start:21 stop:227 length:207 start_codon:yes stop_codon:yes gene_type:complete